jgi:polyphosphate kinase 2 (PPK2 family)
MSHHAAARKAKNGSPKIWKLSPIDYAAMARWDDYTRARDEMFAATDRPPAPWTVVLSNDKRRARLGLIRHVLSTIDYAGKDGHILLVSRTRLFSAAPS